MTGTTLSGIERMRRIRDGEDPPPSMAVSLGFDLVEVEDGAVAFEGAPSEDHLNPMGTVHGGWALTLLDSATGAAVHTTVPAGSAYATLEIKVNLVRPLTPGSGLLRAEGRVVHRGRRVVTSEGRLVGAADGRLYAHATATCMIMEL